MSKLSMKFEFDAELFKSRTYQQALRGTFKEAIRRRKKAVHQITLSKEEQLRSEAIDRRIHEDEKQLSQECKVLLFGLRTGNFHV